MSRWFRFYDEAVNDPKIIKLSDDIFRAWVNLLCVASKHDGNLPTTDDIAIILRVKVARAATIIAELVSWGLLDKTETGFAPHNWNGRQYKSDVSTERVKRFRNGKRNVSETPPDTEQIQITETDQKESVRAKRATRLPDDWIPSEADKMFALGRRMSVEAINTEATKFRNYWTAKGGQGATKTNWERTWQNWILNSNGAPNGNRAANQRSTGHDAILAVATRAARKIVGDGEMAGPADEDKFSFGDGSFGSGPQGFDRASGCLAPSHNGREPPAGAVLEGEVVPFDKAAAGLSRGRGGL